VEEPMDWINLPLEVLWTLVGVFGGLVLATAVVVILRWWKPERNFTELQQRVYSWWVMVVLFTAAMVLSRTVSLVFFAFISFLALKEYLSLIPTRRADRRPLFWVYLTIPLQYYWVYDEWYGMFIIFIPVIAFLFVPMRMLLVGETEGYIRATGTIHWGLMTTVFSLSHAAFLLILREKPSPSSVLPSELSSPPYELSSSPPYEGGVGGVAGPGLMLYLVMLTQLNDVFQYIWGKSLGRHKIVPTVSPGKTWEGFLGGVATTTLLAWLLRPVLTPMNDWQSLLAGAIISVGGFFGDINVSAVKRDLGLKDAGSLLPGHGGILDRVNSLTYTAPLFFHYIYYLFEWHTFGASGRL
jgi:phosphatidate cytidylyltransferase